MVDPQSHSGEEEEDEQASQEADVELEVLRHLARDADEVDLGDDDAEDGDDDDG